MLSKDIFVPLTICIDQTRRALVIVLPCYGALQIVSVIIIIIITVNDRAPKYAAAVYLRAATEVGAGSG